MRRARQTTLLLAALLALALPAHAAASPNDVIRDCEQNGRLTRHYSHSDLKKAHDRLPSDANEYSDCRSVIERAMAQGSPRAGGGNGGGGGGVPGGGGTGGPAATAPAPTASDRSALKAATARARSGTAPHVALGGGTVTPAATGLTHPAGSANKLPGPVLLALIAIAALAAAGAGFAGWRRWPQLRRVALRLVRR